MNKLLMVEQIKIKTELKPQRCEVCHQSDCFEPEINSCSRCSSIEVVEQKDISKKNLYYTETAPAKKEALYSGVMALAVSFLSVVTLDSQNSYLLVSIFVTLMYFVVGISSLIDWFYLRSGKESLFQKHRNLLFKLRIFVLIGGPVVMGLIEGNLGSSLFFFVIVFLIILLWKPRQFFKK